MCNATAAKLRKLLNAYPLGDPGWPLDVMREAADELDRLSGSDSLPLSGVLVRPDLPEKYHSNATDAVRS